MSTPRLEIRFRSSCSMTLNRLDEPDTWDDPFGPKTHVGPKLCSECFRKLSSSDPESAGRYECNDGIQNLVHERWPKLGKIADAVKMTTSSAILCFESMPQSIHPVWSHKVTTPKSRWSSCYPYYGRVSFVNW